MTIKISDFKDDIHMDLKTLVRCALSLAHSRMEEPSERHVREAGDILKQTLVFFIPEYLNREAAIEIKTKY